MNFKFDDSGLRRKISDLAKCKSEVMPPVHKFFVEHTPKRKGNARANTKLNNLVIEANYPYAGKLDQGWSKQDPQGMTKPTEVELKRRVIAWIKQHGVKNG